MSLESFFREVALRQASADRDNLKLLPPWWRRLLATLPPTTKRFIAVTIVAALAAADVLGAVVHHASPIERAHHLMPA